MSSSDRDLEGARHFQEQLDEDEVFQMAVTKLVNTMAGTNDDLDDQHPADATAEIVLDEDATVARSSGLTNTWPSDCPSVG